MLKQPTIRQGDVLLVPVAALPAGCTEVPQHGGRIVLAYGEVTGHAHAIADHHLLDLARTAQAEYLRAEGASVEVAQAAIARAKARASLLVAPDGARYLDVTEPVTLRHEEHTAHTIPAGVYLLPTQVEYTPAELVRVAD